MKRVNDGAGCVILAHPVANRMEIPDRGLARLPSANWQALTVAVGQAGVG